MPDVRLTDKDGKTHSGVADRVVDTHDGQVRIEGTKWGTIYWPKHAIQISGTVEDSEKK